MNQQYELEVRLGPHHFSAKGPAEAVREDYQQFLAKLDKADLASALRTCGKGWPAIPPELTQLFTACDDGILALKEPVPRPLREARSLLVLLYGFLVIESQASVTATQLRQAAERSGLTIGRLDRGVARYVDKGFVVREGVRRGTHYSLTENGIQWTQAYLQKLSKQSEEK